MLKINRLEYKSDHLVIELNNGELLRIPFNVSGLFRVEQEREIDSVEYMQLKDESSRFLCRKNALDYLAMKSRSTQEMENYLKKKGFDFNIITEVIFWLKESGYIDDFDFALRYIKNRVRKKPVGRNLLKRDLYEKGISKNIAAQALDESGINELNNEDLIYETAKKKYESLNNKKNKIQKLVYFLQQRGFDYEVVNKVVQRIVKEETGDDC